MKAKDYVLPVATVEVVAILFFNSIIAMVMMLPLAYILIRRKKILCEQEELRKEKIQFADAIASVAGAMEAGYSIENAFYEAYKDMITMYGKNSKISNDFLYIVNKLKMNISLEQTLREYAEKSNIDEVTNLSDIICITKKSGGNIAKVMKGTKDMIYENEDLQREIEAVISSKKYENTIMQIMPLGMIGYLRLFSPGYMDICYESMAGRLMMCVILLLYAICIVVSDKMIKIDI